MKNRKKQKVYIRRRIVFMLVLLLIILLIFLNTKNKNNIQKIALGENALEVGGEQIDISGVISTEPNAPTVGAGMIPIKWNESMGMWQITTVTDSDWYNYANGKWANVMLSDGYYKSELQVNSTWEQVAEKNVGAQIREEQLGSIFTWIPRLAYLEGRVEFLKNTSVIDYMWTTESCFNLEKYGANYLDLAFTGIWIGQNEFANATELANRNAQMYLEDNKEGLIANEQISSLTNSEKIVAQKLHAKYSVSTNKTMLQNIENMQYRQVIKIVNTNSRLPIMGTHVLTNESIIIKDKYSENGIKYVVDKDGDKLERNTAALDEEETLFTCYIIDNVGNIRKYKANYGTGRPYLKGFSKSNTFYVTYDENGNEESIIPIGEDAPENWYSYEEQKWANVVVRNNANETYYVWIPRYMYKLNTDGSETVDARFVDLENVWTDKDGKQYDLDRTDYILPEAFTWEDPEDPNSVVQLTGFWASKYKLREGSTYIPEISGGSGVIRVNNVITNIGSDYTYEMYLIKNGKRIVWDEESVTYVEGTETIQLTGNYIFKNVEPGEYVVNIIVKDSEGNYVRAVANSVSVLEKVEPNKPDLTGYNKNLTYYVTYDEEGFENSTIPIGEEPPEGWYNYDNQQWANIVVRDNGTESYFTWIPRYEYTLDDANEKTNVQFIPVEKETPDTGYIIPEAFSWEDPEDSTKLIQLSGFWASKYKLRTNEVYNLGATVTPGETSIKIGSINAKVSEIASYEATLVQDGKIIKTETLSGTEHSFTGLNAGETYGVNLVAKNADGKMIAGYSKEVTLVKIEVDLTGFNKNTTFYVTYDENGNEDSSVPIGEEPPANWSNYAEQKWANVVSRDNGNEIYYVWIPRYQYILDDTNEKTNVEFIPVTKEIADPGYIIPEAFTWEDPTDSNKVIQLSGFWASKYKLREGTTYFPEISGGSGVVRVNNVITNIGSDYTYELYLIKDGKRIVWNGNSYVEGTTPITMTGNYVFENVPAGDYSVNIIVKNSDGVHVRAVSNQVRVLEKVYANEPDLTGFNENVTFYVTYDGLGNEQSSSIPIGEDAPEGWYDYDKQQWANIVVRENGTESYYTWIPRYEYTLDDANEKTNVQFIGVEQTVPDEGYTIPEAFTWEDPNDSTKVIQLSGFWASKYKLRDDSTCRLSATVAVGANKIRVSNIIATSDVINYKVYLIKDGKVIDNATMTKSSDHTFTVSEYGIYSVALTQWSTTDGIVAGFAKEVELKELESPDVTGFRVDTTYIVTYDDSGNENNSQTLQSVLKPGYTVDSNNALVSGQIDESKINGVWYDYAEQKWANIVTINNEKTIYYTWIPRYQYLLDETDQRVIAMLIPKTKETPDPGYIIPEAFTWEEPTDSTKVVQLSGFWASKYKLRS